VRWIGGHGGRREKGGKMLNETAEENNVLTVLTVKIEYEKCISLSEFYQSQE
jgi:hypothetical protein